MLLFFFFYQYTLIKILPGQNWVLTKINYQIINHQFTDKFKTSSNKIIIIIIIIKIIIIMITNIIYHNNNNNISATIIINNNN